MAEIDQELSKVRPFQGWDFKRSCLEIHHCREPVCSLFRVKAIASAEDHGNTSYVIELETLSGEVTEVIVPNGMLTRNAPAALEIMADKGFKSFGDAKPVKHLIMHWPTCAPQMLATHLGWDNRDFFVLATGEVLTAPAYEHDVVYSQKATAQASGSLEGWKDGIGRLAIGNPYLIFVCCAAFAGAILPFIPNAQSFGVHLFLGTSTGKSKLLQAAESVWPRSLTKKLKTWRSTGNALEGQMVEANNTVLCMDELPKSQRSFSLADVIYMLGNEAGKGRATKEGNATSRASWKTIMLSTGEDSMLQTLEWSGEKVRGGIEVRMLDVPIDARFGAFDCLHALPDGRTFADTIGTEANTHFGHAGPAFVSHLLENPQEFDRMATRVSELETELLKELGPQDRVASEIPRIIRQFAVIAYAGTLATQAGVTGWKEEDILPSMQHVVRQWFAARDGAMSSDLRTVVKSIQRYVHALRTDELFPLNRAKEAKGPKVFEDENFFYFLKIPFTDAIDGVAKATACKELKEAGLLIPPKEDGDMTRISDRDRSRTYKIAKSIMNR
ncbi:MAG: DUF927 domain-containing protein [Donghicola eburneus]|nr:DUF927 domain-containing protein [Donghicola eburneus]MCI5041656.1 DUF927 domain-containing protein [Donghicola eburneus]